jgi:hypothetical protein
MQDAFLELVPHLQWCLYVGAFAALAVWETLLPRKKLVASTPWRWLGNVTLAAAAQLLYFGLVPVGSVISAIVARNAELGLLNHSEMPIAVQAVIGILALDFTRYLQHRLFHAVGPLWRIHQIHHSDVDMDLTTGVRHHPLESVVSAATYFPVVWLLGAPPISVAAFELFLVFHVFFLPREYPYASTTRGCRQLADRHARYASCSPLRPPCGKPAKLRPRLFCVGPPLWDLSGPTERWTRSYGARHQRLSRRFRDERLARPRMAVPR